MSDQIGFFHNVYFWLRETSDPDAARQLASGCQRYLTGIPCIIKMSVGVPAGTPREVVDNSYGVALLLEFADVAAHNAYQDHPDHLLFIQNCSHLWSRVQIYDTISLGEGT